MEVSVIDLFQRLKGKLLGLKNFDLSSEGKTEIFIVNNWTGKLWCEN